MRLGRGPGNETEWQPGNEAEWGGLGRLGGDLGMRLGGGPGNETGWGTWE